MKWSIEVAEWQAGREWVKKVTLESVAVKTLKVFIWDAGNARVVIRFKNRCCTGWKPSQKTLVELTDEIEWEIRVAAGLEKAKTA